MKKALIPLVEGFEEIEATVSIGVLRRAGIEVVTAGMPGTIIPGARGMKMIADKTLESVNPDEFDALVLVGGDPGYRNLAKSQKLMDAIRDFHGKRKVIGAICASPTILADMGILEDRKATIHPGMERRLSRPRGSRVVVDGHIVTSQAPGTSMDFALKLVEMLMGPMSASDLREEIVY
jgi:4-methyl-5(b-hydroxyethyl)-thiazole monophosphate biosynthesis